jgi:hypothetical protein
MSEIDNLEKLILDNKASVAQLKQYIRLNNIRGHSKLGKIALYEMVKSHIVSKRSRTNTLLNQYRPTAEQVKEHKPVHKAKPSIIPKSESDTDSASDYLTSDDEYDATKKNMTKFMKKIKKEPKIKEHKLPDKPTSHPFMQPAETETKSKPGKKALPKNRKEWQAIVDELKSQNFRAKMEKKYPKKDDIYDYEDYIYDKVREQEDEWMLKHYGIDMDGWEDIYFPRN